VGTVAERLVRALAAPAERKAALTTDDIALSVYKLQGANNEVGAVVARRNRWDLGLRHNKTSRIYEIVTMLIIREAGFE
jgi:hypothetical protein